MRGRSLVVVTGLAVAGSLLVVQPSDAQLAGCSSGRTGSAVTEPGPYGIGRTDVVELASDIDGAVIQIGLVRPDVDDSHRSPIIVHAGSYFLADLKDVDLVACHPFLVDNYVPHGYTVAYIPTRGAGDTDVCANLMGPKERGDLDQAVTWLGTQPWSNGNVGMIGLSYDGSTPWEVASMGNPHLATIVPASGVHNLFDLIYYRGRNDWRWWFFVSGYYHYYGLALNTPVQGRDVGRYLDSALSCDDLDHGMAATLESYRTGEYDQYGYWAERNMDPSILDEYRGSVLLVQGMQDWNVDPAHQYPFVSELESRGRYVKHLLGQWDHTWPDGTVGGRDDFADLLLRWWDRWLKGDESVDTGPRAEVQDSSMRWRVGDAWPPAASRQALHLGAEETMGPEPDPATGSTLVSVSSRNRYFFVSDGTTAYNDLPIDRVCLTCATFTFDVGEADLRFAGIPELDLTLVPTGSAGHIAAFLFRVDGDDWHLLGWGASDLRFPQGGYEAQPVVAGEELRMTLPLQPLDAVVPAGQQLMLLLDQGHADHMPSAPIFPVEVLHGAELGTIRLPVIEVADDDFFEPPLAVEVLAAEPQAPTRAEDSTVSAPAVGLPATGGGAAGAALVLIAVLMANGWSGIASRQRWGNDPLARSGRGVSLRHRRRRTQH